MADITHGYDRLAGAGIKVVNARAETIDRDGKAVVLADGSRVPYDRLVLSPGVSFKTDFLPGYTEAAMEKLPHAWKAGPQTELLKARLDALQDGATVVMTVPGNPYRCPPGPYERISLIAHLLKSRGHARSKIVVLDDKEKFSKQALFQEGWEAHYPGMVEWLPPSVHGGFKSVDADTGTVVTALDSFKGDLVNLIPPRRPAPSRRPPADGRGWLVRRRSRHLHLEGRSRDHGRRRRLQGRRNAEIGLLRQQPGQGRRLPSARRGRRPLAVDPLLFNTCWSLIAPDDGVKVGALYAVKDGALAAKTSFVSKTGESAEERRKSVAEAVDWYAAITADMFG